MFEDALKKRIEELDEHLVSYSKDKLSFHERQKDGAMEVTLNLAHPCIMFRDLDEHCLSYFKSKKTADCIVFERKDLEAWVLHIFKMKKTVKVKEWKKIYEQFKGAFYNALALAGFLGIELALQETKLYTCYQVDKIKEMFPASRLSFGHNDLSKDEWMKNDSALACEWLSGKVNLSCFESLCFPLEKIEVLQDEDGRAKGYFDMK